jgi:uncharacterized protein (DUF305 family)
MKYVVIAVLAISLTACERPPKVTDTTNQAIDHSQMDHSDHDAMDHSAMASSPGAAQAPLELQFIDTMIAHHQGAVDMAKLVDGRTENRQMQTFADGIINAQEREIAEMTRIRSKRFANNPPALNMDFPGMREGMGGMDMKKLGTLSGTEFDIEFATQMIPHHKGAIAMSNALLAGVLDPELRKLAETIIKDQTAEIDQMQKWISEWRTPSN